MRGATVSKRKKPMARQPADPSKPKRIVKPAGPRPVFILVKPVEGVSVEQVKGSITGFSLDVNAVLDQVEASNGQLGFKRIMIPRSARKRTTDATPTAA